MADGINYSELASPGQQKQFYPEGAEFVHPSGTVYKRINGNWKVISIIGQKVISIAREKGEQEDGDSIQCSGS